MTPTGKDLLSILVNLLADQEGVTIKYEYISKNEKGE
jgi:hypothetical protein